MIFRELVGFVDEVTAPSEVGRTGKKYNLFKFVLNNNNSKRITCLVWGLELIRKYESEIKINRVIF